MISIELNCNDISCLNIAASAQLSQVNVGYFLMAPLVRIQSRDSAKVVSSIESHKFVCRDSGVLHCQVNHLLSLIHAEFDIVSIDSLLREACHFSKVCPQECI